MSQKRTKLLLLERDHDEVTDTLLHVMVADARSIEYVLQCFRPFFDILY